MLQLPESLAIHRVDELGWSAAVSSGYPALDAQLPGGGWPLDGMVEILQPRFDQPMWPLLLPALAVAATQQAGPVVMVSTPYQPFAPAFAALGIPPARLMCVRASKPSARLWSAEQALRCAEVAAVLAWLPQSTSAELRRLQLAAQKHGRLLFVLRGLNVREHPSPARLRLQLEATPDALLVHVLKRRGPPLVVPLTLPAWHARVEALLASRRAKVPALPVPAAQAHPHDKRRSHVLDRPVPQP